jgi:excinuclease ABC subunit A
VVEADALPKLKKNEKHDIDVVIDRLRVRPDMKQRLAESFEAALRIADGRAICAGDGHPAQRAPLQQQVRLPGVQLRAARTGAAAVFSFNSARGRLPACDGLGQVTVFDPERVVAFPSLSLAAGAVKGWDRRNAYTHSLLESVARHYGFDIETPFESLPRRRSRCCCTAAATTRSNLSTEAEGANGKHAHRQARHPFEGIIPNFERRFRETDSVAVREELSRYQAAKPCPLPRHALRREARHVFLAACGAARAASPSTRSSTCHAGRCAGLLRRPAAGGRQGRDRRQGGARDPQPAALPERRGPELPEPGPQRRHAERRRGAAHPPGQPDRQRLSGVMYVLDEPSIGLHQRDNERLIGTLRHLRDLGNSVLVVEHDEDMIRAADHVVDMGPGAGVHGGRVIAQGTPHEVATTPSR